MARPLTRLVVFLVAAAALAGCASPEAAPAASTAAATPTQIDVGQGTECLRGQVVDTELQPIAEAQVGLIEVQKTLSTDAGGAFEFCGLESGTYRLVVSRLGYEDESRAIEVPTGEGTIQIVLTPIPVIEPYFVTHPKMIYYSFGLSTLDTTTSRYGVNLTNCGPCTWSLLADEVPDVLYWEATWVRNPAPPEPVRDMMYHILRGGAPFEAATDIGTGTHAKPWVWNYTKDALLKNANVKNAKDGVPFSGSMYCWGEGNQPWPCIDQRISNYVTLLYDYEEVPAGFTALPPK